MFLRIDYDAVALAQIGDLGPQLDHFAHVFVTENIPGTPWWADSRPAGEDQNTHIAHAVILMIASRG